MAKLTRLEKTAYHEAGHAVMHHFLGVSFRYATIKPGEDSWGHVRHFPLPKSFDPNIEFNTRIRNRMEKEIMIANAGHAAEAIMSKRHNWKGANEDMRRAAEFSIYLNDNEEQNFVYLKWMWLRTMNFLKQPWRWAIVEAVAQALLDRQRLSQKEVRKIIYETIQKRVRK